MYNKILPIILTLLLPITSFAFGFKFNILHKTYIKNFGSYRAYSNNSTAQSCDDYRNPTNTTKSYSGDIGDGLYLLNPDNGTPFIAYCDMTTDTTGWTLIFAGGMSATTSSPSINLFSGNSTENFNFTVLGVTMNTQYLMQVIKRMPLQNIRFGTAKFLSWSNNTTFSQKYSARTAPSSSNCQTNYLGPRATYSGWDLNVVGTFTTANTLLGCSVGVGDPQNPQDGGTLDYQIAGLNIYVTSEYSNSGSYPYSVRFIYGEAGHRHINNYAYSMTDKSTLVWMK